MKFVKQSFLWLLVPLVILLALGSTMIYERSGVDYEVRYPPMEFLPPEHIKDEILPGIEHSKTLFLYNSNDAFNTDYIDNYIAVLEGMKVSFDVVNIYETDQYDYSDYEIVFVALIDISVAEDRILDLMNWVEKGGRVLFAFRPDPSDTFTGIYRRLGIRSTGEDLQATEGIEFLEDILPGATQLEITSDFLTHSSYPCSLEPTATVYAQSADEFAIPLIWSYELGQGKIVFVNSDQFITKSSRGTISAAYALLPEVFAYPVINASVFFIDDFPAPIPEGTTELLKEQYGRDIQSFMINVWWPDLEAISNQYGIYFTTVMIETYNDHVNPPFEKQPEIERHQYFGGLVLQDGGELGLHGYNHVSLCVEEEGINAQLGYPGWPSDEAMELSVYELYTFATDLFPDNEFVTYVPTSNVLCQSSRNWLPQVLPDLRVISSVYLEEEEGLAYEQEFEEAADGIIELPRVIAGYDITDYMEWAAINELGFHLINSHFVHPDDVLNDDRGAQKGWETLRTQFESYVEWLYQTLPQIRNMTAKEAAMALQRYDRVQINSSFDGQFYQMELSNFYDEAWFMLHTQKTPANIAGGTISQISENVYLVKAEKSEITIQVEE
jgi:hypothetical protein